MKKSVLDLKGVVSSGGGLIIDANEYSTLDLKGIASSASKKGVKITLKNSKKLSTLDLKGIASSGKGSIIFDMT